MTSAERLQGMILPSGWYVDSIITKTSTQTGGTFSTSYLLTKPDGSKAFLKAMDFDKALIHHDPAAKLNELTNAYLFERSLLELCGQKKLSRVVRAIDSGKVVAPVTGAPVQYLIFELANGDVRQNLNALSTFDLPWRLRCLHHIFVGVQQLHTNTIAHQDVKPSNVLGYGIEGHKLADLGRAWRAGLPSPYDDLPCAGSRPYSPPEVLYQGAVLTEEEKRYGTDFYMLGSMVFFMFSGLRMTAAMMTCLPPAYRWTAWTGTYDDALPYLEHGFADVLNILRGSIQSQILWDEIKDILQQMCAPDIKKRGDKRHLSKIGSRFMLQRLVSRLDNLAKKAEIGKLSFP